MDIAIGWVVGVVIGLAIGLGARGAGVAKARREARAAAEEEWRGAVSAVREGRVPDASGAEGPAAELAAALGTAWAPKEAERRAALVDALGRVARFLDRQVREPLAGAAPGADAAELRERIDRALGALQDVDFFLEDAEHESSGTDLVPLVRQVSREFAEDHAVAVRLQLGAPVIPATIGREPLMDALYLVLHNAARFGEGSTIGLTVVHEDGHPRIRVRDRGPGFSEQAFQRAFDPFYSESEEGLGLGLPHARRTVEAMGGTVALRNVPDGGAEVEITLPG